jgi:hypothetical protein
MDTLYELTGAECEAVAGGTFHFHLGQGGGGGVHVSQFNHFTGTGPGNVLQNGPLVSFEVHAVQSGATSFSPEVSFLWEVPFFPG